MKWVKASERLPNDYGKVHWRDSGNWPISVWLTYTIINSGNRSLIEWLDESPQPFPGIEERAKELFPTKEQMYIISKNQRPNFVQEDDNEVSRKIAIQLATEATEQLRGDNEKLSDELNMNKMLLNAWENRYKELEQKAGIL